MRDWFMIIGIIISYINECEKGVQRKRRVCS